MTAIVSFTGFACLACLVVWFARRRSRKWRAEVERAGRLRMAEHDRVMARWNARMPLRHPETPGEPSEAEAALLAELLDGIDINPGGPT
jgi:hypothetical protein